MKSRLGTLFKSQYRLIKTGDFMITGSFVRMVLGIVWCNNYAYSDLIDAETVEKRSRSI